MSDFPLITAALPAKQAHDFLAAVATVDEAHNLGSIANAIFVDVKSEISRRFETIFRHAVTAALTTGAERDEAELNIYYLQPALHLIDRQLSKVEQSTCTLPIKAVALGLLREIAPVASKLTALKSKTVKRVVRTEEERTPRYAAPRSTSASVKLVVDLLENLVAESFERLVQSFAKREQDFLDAFLKAQDEARAANKSLSAYDHFNSRTTGLNRDGYDAVEALTTTPYAAKASVTVVRPDKDTILQERAEKAADAVRILFLSKNTRKLVSIVEAKNNLTEAKTVGCEVDLGGMTGTLFLAFADGSSFYAVNSVVWAVSTRGRYFYRTPLTFRDVKLAGAVKMPRPSEQRMNEVFVQVAKAAA